VGVRSGRLLTGHAAGLGGEGVKRGIASNHEWCCNKRAVGNRLRCKQGAVDCRRRAADVGRLGRVGGEAEAPVVSGVGRGERGALRLRLLKNDSDVMRALLLHHVLVLQHKMLPLLHGLQCQLLLQKTEGIVREESVIAELPGVSRLGHW